MSIGITTRLQILFVSVAASVVKGVVMIRGLSATRMTNMIFSMTVKILQEPAMEVLSALAASARST